MIFAAYYNKPEIIRYLHSIGCSVEQTGKSGESPLSRACYYKRYESISELLSLGANINAKNTKTNEYPIINSIYRDNVNLLQFVLNNGADYHILDHQDYSDIMNNASPELKKIIKEHKSFKERIPFLLVAKYSRITFSGLSNGILKEIAMFIS